MDEEKHTPTYSRCGVQISCGAIVVALACGSDETADEMVLACNSHAQREAVIKGLVKACEGLVDYVEQSERGHIDPDQSHDAFECTLDNIKGALAAAKEN